MRLDYLHLKRKPAQSALPTARDEHRGDLRVLSGDGSTTTDGFYFGRNRAGTLEFTQLVAADFPEIAGGLVTRGGEPSGTVNAATMGNGSTLTFDTDSNDISGQISIVTGGTGFGAGTYCTVTFAVPKASVHYDVWLSYQSGDARTLGIVGVTNRATTGFDIVGLGTPVVTKTYQWGYLVIERKAA
jgi:hypothetical protein